MSNDLLEKKKKPKDLDIRELLEKNDKSEEIDLVLFFNLIGNALNRILAKFTSASKSLYSIFIAIAKAIFLNIKLITTVFIAALVIGTVLDVYKAKVYYAEMYVKPYFESKYELVNSIAYYNSLIKLGDKKELSNQFNITEEEANSIVEFKIEVGPESKNDQIKEYNNFIKDLDSAKASKYEFKDFIKNRNLFSTSVYLIKVRSNKYDIFKKLEKAIDLALQNKFSEASKKEKETVLNIESKKLQEALFEVRTLKKKYLDILDIEAKKTTISSGLESAFSLKVDKTETKEDVLLEREMDILNKLSSINKELAINNTLYDKISSFKEKGLIENIWHKKFKIILPLLSLVLLCLFYLLLKFYKYTINFKN